MKVFCISKGSYHLTTGKVYDVKEITGDDEITKFLFSYMIINDRGHEHFIEGDLFVTLEDIRDSKLKELGI